MSTSRHHDGFSRRELIGLAGGFFLVGGCRRRFERPPVLLITLDTTRRDHLGCYGYSRATSPNLDALARESIVYTRAVAASSWTLPSHASIFTGKFPKSHGAQYDPEGPLQLTQAIGGHESWARYRARGLSPGETTLAGVLRGAGYRTGAVVAGPWMKKVFGLDQGFEDYDDRSIQDINGRLASEVTSAALSWLNQDGKAPFFLFLNYFDPHGPFEAPPPFRGSFGDEIADRYDEEILYMDYHIGRLLEGMKKRGIFDECLIVVTSDHGELFGEHGRFGHGNTLYEEEVRVPLIVKFPSNEQPPEREETPVHHIDILPVILKRLGLQVPLSVQGRVPTRVAHPMLSEVHPLPFASSEGEWRALYRGRYKLLWNGPGRHALFDIEADPREQVDLAEGEPGRTKSMLALIEGLYAFLPAPGSAGPAATPDEETLRALRSLGYVP